MKILIANFGNDSIALIEWLRQQHFTDVIVVSVDTGWAAPRWQERVLQAGAYLDRCGFEHVRLQSPLSFPELVKERHNFPSQKFHWCAKFLKGLPILDWLDDVDPDLNATVMMAKRRSQAAALKNLAEYEPDYPLMGGRLLWCPLFQADLATRNQLIATAGFDLLDTRSLECDPCIYNQARDFQRMEVESRQSLGQLEKTLGKSMFANYAIQTDANLGSDERDVYFSGCGSEFGCGE